MNLTTRDFTPRIRKDYKTRKKTLGHLLRAARKSADLTQSEAAYLLACTQPALSRMETSGNVEFVQLERMAALYGKELGNFTTLDKETAGRYPWAPDESGYEGWALSEWKGYLKNGQEWGRTPLGFKEFHVAQLRKHKIPHGTWVSRERRQEFLNEYKTLVYQREHQQR